MNYCSNCGAKIQSEVKCDYCGAHQSQIRKNIHQSFYLASDNSPGAQIIKIVSIILIVFGALGSFLSFMIIASNDFNYLASESQSIIFFEFSANIMVLVFSIIGIKLYKDKSKANYIIIMGCVLLITRIVDLVWALNIYDNVDYSIIFGSIIGSTLPILYIIGGFLRKRAK